MHKSILKFSEKNCTAPTEQVFNASSSIVIKSFSVLMQRQNKIPKQKTLIPTHGVSTQSRSKQDLPLKPISQGNSTTTSVIVSRLFSQLREYTSEIHKKPIKRRTNSWRGPSLEKIEAASQMLLLTLADDLNMFALDPESFSAISTIIGADYLDDFTNVWKSWDAWWRESYFGLAPETLLEGECCPLALRSPIEAFVFRYGRPVLSRPVKSVVARTKKNYYLTTSGLHIDHNVERDHVREKNRVHERNASLKKLMLERMKSDFLTHEIGKSLTDKSSNLDSQMDRNPESLDTRDPVHNLDVDSLMKQFFSTCLKHMRADPGKQK